MLIIIKLICRRWKKTTFEVFLISKSLKRIAIQSDNTKVCHFVLKKTYNVLNPLVLLEWRSKMTEFYYLLITF